MKKFAFSIVVLSISITAVFPTHARNTKYIRSIAAAMSANDPEEKPDGSVKFFFGEQKTPRILSNLGTYTVSLRTNALGKSDERACNLALLSMLVVLERHARQQGGDAVVNIVSYYNKMKCRARLISSATQGFLLRSSHSRARLLRLPMNKFYVASASEVDDWWL